MKIALRVIVNFHIMAFVLWIHSLDCYRFTAATYIYVLIISQTLNACVALFHICAIQGDLLSIKSLESELLVQVNEMVNKTIPDDADRNYDNTDWNNTTSCSTHYT